MKSLIVLFGLILLFSISAQASFAQENIGEVMWLEDSYPANGTGTVRVIDADMNLDPDRIEFFNVDVWSDSDAGGIDLTVFLFELIHI